MADEDPILFARTSAGKSDDEFSSLEREKERGARGGAQREGTRGKGDGAEDPLQRGGIHRRQLQEDGAGHGEEKREVREETTAEERLPPGTDREDMRQLGEGEGGEEGGPPRRVFRPVQWERHSEAQDPEQR